MTIDDKYVKLLGKYVYNKDLDKFGHISAVEIMQTIEGNLIGFNVFYDTFDSNVLTFFEDFEKGKLQFAVIEDYTGWSRTATEEIKEALGDSFSTDKIKYVTEAEKYEKDRKNDQRNVQMLHTDMVDLTSISADVMAEDFYSREIYLKYRKGVLTKGQALYALVNHLAQELKRVQDRNTEYFLKYEFLSEMEKGECDF